MKRPKKTKGSAADLESFLEDLSPNHPGAAYDPREKFRDYRNLFLSTPLGKKVLWDILILCRLYKSSMHADSHVTAFNEGKREIGLRVLGIMNTEPSEQQVERDDNGRR